MGSIEDVLIVLMSPYIIIFDDILNSLANCLEILELHYLQTLYYCSYLVGDEYPEHFII